LAATILGCVVRALRLGAAQALVDHLTVPALRRFVGSVTSAGLVSIVALGPSTPAGAEPPRPSIAVMHQLNSQPTPAPATVVSPAPTASMRQLDSGPEASIEPVATTATVDDMWTVAPGDSFWLVAQEHLAATTGARPSEREVTRYWRALIEANRASLPDPLNPDLLFAAAVLVLPPV
ncbi:MAG: resuscitation-promoting factor RpfA, partial [Acidimicrobiaceae bacterium]